MAVLGSDRALVLLDSVYKDISHFQALQHFRQEFTELPPFTWAQNLYWNWLYCLMPLLTDKGPGYPYFMQTLAWRDRELLTALASWGELRHDTILYAKQSSTLRTGEEPTPPPVPRNYVEPNPPLFARLAALVRYTREGLDARGLLLEPYKEKLHLFEVMLHFFKNMAKKELGNVPLTQEESDLIAGFGDAMKQLVSGPKDPTRPWEDHVDDMAIVADVHTDHNTLHCLEEGVGYPLEIDVIVYENGEARICRGALFSYYEFRQPIAERLTDEAWREMLASGSPPEMPVWVNAFIPKDTSRPPLEEWFSPEVAYSHQFTGIESESLVNEKSFRLVGLYPNPFNASVRMRFEISSVSSVNIEIYTLSGKRVRAMEEGILGPGVHEVLWDGKDDFGWSLPSGVYVIRVCAGKSRVIGKVTLLK